MPTNTQALDAVIAALEKATGPDRELDADIFRAATGAEVWNYHDNCHIDAQIKNGLWKLPREDHPDFEPQGDQRLTWRYRIEKGPRTEYGEVPRLTESLDSAVALVPEGAEYSISTLRGIANVHFPPNYDCLQVVRRKDRNVILAVIEAALRARRALAQQESVK